MPSKDYFREMAQRCAALARECTTPTIQRRMLVLADQYEKKAREMESASMEGA